MGKPWDRRWSTVQSNFAKFRDLESSPGDEKHDMWWQLVWEYSKGGLSQETDRLVAIAGLAKCLDPVAKDVYLAGLWRNGLSYDLVWSATDRAPRRGGKYLAPSWSWASIPAGITVARPYIWPYPQPVADVLDAQTQAVDDAFGAIAGGFIRIRARLCVATSTIWASDTIYCRSGDCALRLGKEKSPLSFVGIKFDDERGYDGQTLFCVGIEVGGLFRSSDIWKGSVPISCGLVVESTGLKKGEFCRVGECNPTYSHIKPR